MKTYKVRLSCNVGENDLRRLEIPSDQWDRYIDGAVVECDERMTQIFVAELKCGRVVEPKGGGK